VGIDVDFLMKFSIGSVALIMASIPGVDQSSRGDGGLGEDPIGLPTRYDPDELKAYFASRPVKVLQRQALVAGKVSSFITAVLADWRMGKLQENSNKRAVWLRTIFESLGPAYVKIAQALSTRVDILPDAYLHEFQKLQDNVPAFPTSDARQLLEGDLGHPVKHFFDEFSDLPIASASLGQVYKAKLKAVYGGQLVAVKIQRPGVMERIALDTLLMRRATELVAKIPTFSETWSEVLDDWASRFFQVRPSSSSRPCPLAFLVLHSYIAHD
jgi:aarF domain-containing kinase